MTALCAVAADKKYVEVDGLTFEINEGRKIAALQKVSDDIVDLVVPEAVTVDGVEYVVNSMVQNINYEEGVCFNHKNLKTVNTGKMWFLSTAAFMGCTSLESVVMPEVDTVEDNCFNGCVSLASIDAPKLGNLSSGTFRDCTALKQCVLPSAYYIGAATFAGCTALESVRFDCPDYIEVGLPPMIGYEPGFWPGTFKGCTSLREVTFASGITKAGEYTLIPSQRLMYGLSMGLVSEMFDGCESLEKITVCKDMTYRTGSLKDLKSLKSLTLGVGCISHLYPDAVTGCDIREIHCMYPVPPELMNDYEPIEVDKATCVVYVPKGCRDRYMQSRYWSGFANIVEDETVEPAFDPALGPKSWVYRMDREERIPDEVGNGYLVIRDIYALYPTSNEGELAFALPCFQFSHFAEDGTPVFRNYVPEFNNDFANIRLLEETVVIDGREYRITEVAPFTAATTSCFSLCQIDIWEGCKRIGRYAFYKSGDRDPVGEETWESLALTINLPSTLESIGEHAFDGMKLVRTINCMAVVPPALEDDSLFGSAEVRADITLNVPMESVTAYRTTPVWSDFKVVGVAGVSEARVDTADGEAEYYNLQGIRVTPDAPGIYIRRTADSVTKVLLRD